MRNNKSIKEIINQDEYYTRPQPTPSADLLKRRPSDSMLWHFRHKPYEIGGDTDAEQGNQRA